MTIVEEIKNLRAKVEQQAAELATLTGTINGDTVAMEAMKVEHVTVCAGKDKQIVDLTASLAEVMTARDALATEIEGVKTALTEATAKLTLAPLADVSNGQKPVADGGAAAVGTVSLVEQLNALGKVSPAGIAFYRAHEKEIEKEMSGTK